MTHAVPALCSACRGRSPARGLTLVELLVALSIMALLATLSWRTLDGMTRTENHTRESAAKWLEWQTAVAQWRTDLDATHTTQDVPGVSFDGLSLRMVRRTASASPGATPSLQVVAWTLQNSASGEEAHWVRWASAPVQQDEALKQAWADSEQWSRSATEALRSQQLMLLPVSRWQVYYHRGGAWTNPLSSANDNDTPNAMPDGIRLELTLPDAGQIQGRITVDWIHPNLGGGKAS
jgi:general secretion pathway protein J